MEDETAAGLQMVIDAMCWQEKQPSMPGICSALNTHQTNQDPQNISYKVPAPFLRLGSYSFQKKLTCHKAYTSLNQQLAVNCSFDEALENAWHLQFQQDIFWGNPNILCSHNVNILTHASSAGKKNHYNCNHCSQKASCIPFLTQIISILLLHQHCHKRQNDATFKCFQSY